MRDLFEEGVDIYLTVVFGLMPFQNCREFRVYWTGNDSSAIDNVQAGGDVTPTTSGSGPVDTGVKSAADGVVGVAALIKHAGMHGTWVGFMVDPFVLL